MLKSRTNSLTTGSDESVEVVRRRALHRLVGSLVLVTLGVVGFPLVFDTEPRPIDTALRVNIPNKDVVPAIGVEADRESTAALESKTEPSETVAKQEGEGLREGTPSSPKADDAAKPSSVAQTPKAPVDAASETQAAPKAKASQSTASAKPAPSQPSHDAARALAILQGKAQQAPVAAKVVRWAVQVGSYSESASVERVRAALKQAGFESFTQSIQTDKGALTRVRIGPFNKEEDAASVIRKLREVGLAASIVKL